jgi:hypothetical protein
LRAEARGARKRVAVRASETGMVNIRDDCFFNMGLSPHFFDVRVDVQDEII